MSKKSAREHPVVFISYSQDSPEHMDKVLALANRLRAEGIDAVLDQYEISPSEGWPKWMDRQIENADFVLVVCTEIYYRRVMATETEGKGLGVRWESTLMYQHLYDAGGDMSGFIPVLFKDANPKHIPTPIRGATYYFVEREEGYDGLYRHLIGQPKAEKPELGPIRALEVRRARSDFRLSLPLGGPKVSVPFAGRAEELEALTQAMGGDKTVVAVVGLAGQGKSCLVGEWYKRGTRPPKGVGLIWRKVYESGYTFDRFLDELYLYLTGEALDRQRFTTVDARAVIVEEALREQPCWIVLDGVERWLKRWVAQPDAGPEGATADDRAGQDAVLDKFLKGASFWENGSRLLLTTRAVPSALDENPPVRIGRKAEDDHLSALKTDDAVKLLGELKVRGDSAIMRRAAQAYGCHPYAVHVLGVMIRDLYGGDVSRWEQVNPLEEPKLEGLFERIVEHRQADLGLLEIIACSVGPAPVRLLAERLGADEAEMRKKLAALAKWQMVEFAADEAGQHTVVRRFLTERMGREKAREIQKALAAWWAEQKVPANPDRFEKVRPLLRAVEHLLAAREPLDAMHIFFTKPTPESYYTVDEWLWRFGYLDEDIRINTDAIRVYIEVIEQEGRRELRNDLAMAYNNRGTALSDQGKLAEAIDDYGRAIAIYEPLVEQEGRRELRNDLAMAYNNRGTALRAQGKLAEAIDDYGRAIAIREQLVEHEGRRELRSDLEQSLFNRAVARSERKEWTEAGADIDKGGMMLQELIGEGHRHVISSFLQTAGFRCAYAEQLGKAETATQWANDAMRWFVEEVQAGRGNEMLLKAASGFAGVAGGNLKVLLKHNLDKALWETFRKTLGRISG